MSNTYLFPTDDPAELARLLQLDTTLTQTMGGAFTGLPDLPAGASILDLACGPGGWVLDAAFERKDCEVAGVDISESMIRYACAGAQANQRPNASFEVMDLTAPLPFSEASFDLINARFLVAALQREAWAPLLAQCWHLLRPGGLLRLTEPVDLGEGSSPALSRLSALSCRALWQQGYGFSVDGRTLGISYRLPLLLRQAGFGTLHTRSYALEVSTGTPAGVGFYHNLRIGGYLIQPVLVREHLSSEAEAKALYEQALVEIYLPNFCGLWQWVSVSGRKPDSDAGEAP